MANREFFKNIRATQQGLVLVPFTIAMASGTTGVIASTFPLQTSKTRLPRSFLTASRAAVGVVDLVLLDGYVGIEAGSVSIINSGTALADTAAQWSKALPFTPTSANSTMRIHVLTNSTGALVDPAAAYALTGALWLTTSNVPR